MENRAGIELEIQWTRLVAIIDEVGVSLQRTCFSSIVREANDFACVLMDAAGDSVAQSSFSVPAFIATLPRTCKKLIKKYTHDGLKHGDVIITNDPWHGTGHLPDLTMITPVFVDDRLVAFAGNIIHLPDIGGGRLATQANEIYEEGLRIPFSKLMIGGEINKTLVDIICANVRVADQVMADIHAQIAANELASLKIAGFMHDHALNDLSELAAAIQSRSESAMRNEIRKIPDGKYDYSLQGDGIDEAIDIKVSIEIKGDNVIVDYAGSSWQSRWAINSVLSYTYAFTAHPLKCVFDPYTPNNEGCFRPIEVRVPEGSILNPRFPASVNCRHQTGHLLQAAIFGALAKVIPERIQADSGLGWVIALGGSDLGGQPYATAFFLCGGQGARFAKDGMNTLAFPSNVSNTPIEVLEAQLPVMYEEKSIIEDSGGPGRMRGGCGQRVILRCTSEDRPVTLSLMADRIVHPPVGFGGGSPGRNGFVGSNRPGPINPKGRVVLHEGETVVLELPGGGGLGNPLERNVDLITRDVAGGYVSREQAIKCYGLEFDQATDSLIRK